MTLLLDALARTLQEPECATRWHTLMSIWLDTADQEARRAVLEALASMVDGELRGDVLRLTFLAGATGESRFENAAADRVLAAEPVDPDRLAALMAYQWLSALQNLEGRTEFIAALCAGRLPEMARRLTASASLLLPPDLLPRAADAIERVAVVVPYVGHQFHTPSMMAVEQSAVLARSGCKVHIFSAQELMPPDGPLFRGDGRKLALPPLSASAWAKILPACVSMTVSDSRFSLPGRWRNLMPVLAGFDPDLVLLVGLFSPLASALHSVRPVAAISVNSVAPIALVDVWLTADPQPECREVWGGVFAPPQPVYHPYRVRPSRQQWPVTRAALGLTQANVVWVTAGFRLQHEIKGEWANRMLQLMSRHPQVVWLLIGGDGTLPQGLRHAEPNRVRALRTRNDLPGIFRCSDIYVNPPRMGGGLSVAEAMAEGLPVTAFAGSDGGDKVGELALADMDAYAERLSALTESRELRRNAGEALRRRFAERYDLEASGPSLLAACREAASLAAARFTNSS